MRSKLINVLIAIMGLCLTIAVGYSAGLLSHNVEDIYRPYYSEGFDFRFQAEQVELAKYTPGVKFDASQLTFANSQQRVTSAKGVPILLFVTNPQCPYAAQSSDIHFKIKAVVENAGLKVAYFPAIFSPVRPEIDKTAYVRTLGFDDYVIWSPSSTIPEILAAMPTPGYLLVDKHGVILQAWFSSGSLETVRTRMFNQMLREIALISQTVEFTEK